MKTRGSVVRRAARSRRNLDRPTASGKYPQTSLLRCRKKSSGFVPCGLARKRVLDPMNAVFEARNSNQAHDLRALGRILPRVIVFACYAELPAVNNGIVKERGQANRGTHHSPGPSPSNDWHLGCDPSTPVLREEVEHSVQRSQDEVSCARNRKLLPAQKAQREDDGMKETQEQAIAMARGGVRYGRVVFHRKGVKLTQDSPRSMLPRDVRANKYCDVGITALAASTTDTVLQDVFMNSTECGCLVNRFRDM